MRSRTSERVDRSGGRGAGPGGATPRQVALWVLVLLSGVFIAENTGRTKIRLLIPEITMPLWLALLGVGVVGAFIGALAMALVLRRR